MVILAKPRITLSMIYLYMFKTPGHHMSMIYLYMFKTPGHHMSMTDLYMYKTPISKQKHHLKLIL